MDNISFTSGNDQVIVSGTVSRFAEYEMTVLSAPEGQKRTGRNSYLLRLLADCHRDDSPAGVSIHFKEGTYANVMGQVMGLSRADVVKLDKVAMLPVLVPGLIEPKKERVHFIETTNHAGENERMISLTFAVEGAGMYIINFDPEDVDRVVTRERNGPLLMEGDFLWESEHIAPAPGLNHWKVTHTIRSPGFNLMYVSDEVNRQLYEECRKEFGHWNQNLVPYARVFKNRYQYVKAITDEIPGELDEVQIGLFRQRIAEIDAGTPHVTFDRVDNTRPLKDALGYLSDLL